MRSGVRSHAERGNEEGAITVKRISADDRSKHLKITGRFEGGFVVFNLCRLLRFVGPPDGDDVESAWRAEKVLAFEVAKRRTRYPSLLRIIDALGRVARLGGRVRFDFNKDDGFTFAIDGDQIDFAGAIGFTLRDND